jgi:hypothetical protein
MYHQTPDSRLYVNLMVLWQQIDEAKMQESDSFTMLRYSQDCNKEKEYGVWSMGGSTIMSFTCPFMTAVWASLVEMVY